MIRHKCRLICWLILAPRLPVHFLHKTFPGTTDETSHCPKFHSSSCLISWLPKTDLCETTGCSLPLQWWGNINNSKIDIRKVLKSKIRRYLFETLETRHWKVRFIINSGLLYPNPYLTSPMFSIKQASLYIFFLLTILQNHLELREHYNDEVAFDKIKFPKNYNQHREQYK